MKCHRCNSERTLEVSAKCADLCFVRMGDFEHNGYVPQDCGITYGDYVMFDLCLECGQLQGKFPRPNPSFTKGDRNHFPGRV